MLQQNKDSVSEAGGYWLLLLGVCADDKSGGARHCAPVQGQKRCGRRKVLLGRQGKGGQCSHGARVQGTKYVVADGEYN